MSVNSKEKRIRICHNLDKILLDSLGDLSQQLDYPQSRMIDEGIRYVLKKRTLPEKKKVVRTTVNLTVNYHLWTQLKGYSDLSKFKLVYLLESALRYCVKRYSKKLKDDLVIFSQQPSQPTE